MSFDKAEQIEPNDCQLQYNLSLSNFKCENYTATVERLKRVV